MQLDSQKQLLSRLGTITKHHKEISRLTGADFNIFRIINVTSDEVKHSAFLAELLNPKGSHGQGTVFLNLFVQKLGVIDFSIETAEVEIEKYIGPVTETTGGRIDIFIDDKMGHLIVIENKIYADDQQNQLIRYFNYKGAIKKNLIYLNLTGEDPKPKSKIHKKLNIELKCDEDYIVKSYKTDILKWLEQCQKEAVSMPLLREGIVSYINLIKHLTGESINKAMQKEIVDLITESPTHLANTLELANNLSVAKVEIQWAFWEALKRALKKYNLELIENNDTVTKKRVEDFYFKKGYWFGLWILVYQKNEISIYWGCEIESNVYFGFTIFNKGNKGISDLPEYNEYQKIISNCDPIYERTKHWLGWQYTMPRLNFREFNSDAIFNLANKRELEQTVHIIAEKAHTDIEFVANKLREIEIASV